MVAGAVLSAALASAIGGRQFVLEIWLGMLAPLAVVMVSWILVERVYIGHPERLRSVMMPAFAAKLVFFGAYVGLAIGVVHVRPVPFIVSFTAYFIALHAIEALGMKRLFVS